jgi:hypothetical protein
VNRSFDIPATYDGLTEDTAVGFAALVGPPMDDNPTLRLLIGKWGESRAPEGAYRRETGAIFAARLGDGACLLCPAT